MKEFNEIEFTVPSSFLCALINGDISGMNDSDIAAIDRFTMETINMHGNALFIWREDIDFRPYNDIDNLGSDCSIVIILVEVEK